MRDFTQAQAITKLEGWHPVKVYTIKEGKSKKSNLEMVTVEFDVVSGPFRGRKVKDYFLFGHDGSEQSISISERAISKFAMLLDKTKTRRDISSYGDLHGAVCEAEFLTNKTGFPEVKDFREYVETPEV